MRYDYQCENLDCGNVQEEVHGMLERPVVVCEMCGCECHKMISVAPDQIFAASVPLYDFVDLKTTTKPVRIKSKRQWHNHLKKVGQVEASNTAPSKSEIESNNRTKNMVAKRELKEAVVASVKDKKHIRETKARVLKSMREGRV